MCNACGFMCCAYDAFEGCGCEHCDNPACWSEDVFDDEPDDIDDGSWELTAPDANAVSEPATSQDMARDGSTPQTPDSGEG